MTTQRQDVYSQITDRIIKAIENGAGKVEMPWHRSGTAHTRPVNILTGNAYRGINIVSLWASAEVNGFSNGVWGTYRQWQEKKAQVRKGEKSSLIVFYKEFDNEAKNPDTGEMESGKRLMARASFVFNADQVDGYERPVKATSDPAGAVERADQFVAATSAEIKHGGEAAYYRRTTDHIQMPPRETFTGTATSSSTEGYYSTLLHELTHWTGHKRRIDRDMGKRFGDNAYAMEELVAELGAAFLCAELGITSEPRPDHAAYLGHWLEVMKADKKAIFTAASQASKAADYLGSLQTKEQEAA